MSQYKSLLANVNEENAIFYNNNCQLAILIYNFVVLRYLEQIYKSKIENIFNLNELSFWSRGKKP